MAGTSSPAVVGPTPWTVEMAPIASLVGRAPTPSTPAAQMVSRTTWTAVPATTGSRLVRKTRWYIASLNSSREDTRSLSTVMPRGWLLRTTLQPPGADDGEEEKEAEDRREDEPDEAEDAQAQKLGPALDEDAEYRRTQDEGRYQEAEDKTVGEDIHLGDQLVEPRVPEAHLDLAVL